MKQLLAFTCVAALASPALAAIDGLNTEYGPALAVQTVGTAFGNNNDSSRDFANGSELNGAYGFISGGTLNLALTGNLETNFNKLEIFFDVAPGGQNRLRGDNPDVDFNGLNRMGDDGSGNGLTFDAGFEADYWVSYTGGNNPAEHFLNAAVLATNGGGPGGFLGGGLKSANDPIAANGPRLGGGVLATFDNSNTLGVGNFGDPNDSDPASVTSGFELAIDLTELGWDGSSSIRVTAFINGGSHDFASNQWLGALPGDFGNLGEPRTINLGGIAGDQFFVVPEPASVSLLALGALALLRRKR